MENTDLSFERSDVRATIIGNVISVKNPISGYIKADSIGELIWDGDFRETSLCCVECTTVAK
jgi:hypothetical protein